MELSPRQIQYGLAGHTFWTEDEAGRRIPRACCCLIGQDHSILLCINVVVIDDINDPAGYEDEE